MLAVRKTADLASALDGPARLLVVDDDPILRELAVAELSRPGTVVVAAEDGEAAWSLLAGDPGFDLVVTDLEMPRISGFSLLDLIRHSAAHSHLPVVVLTSRNDTQAIDRAYEIGATSFVQKPVDWRLLRYQLRYVLRASRMEAPIRAARDEAETAAALKNGLLSLLQHETRTPLNAIIGFAELMRSAMTDPRAADAYLQDVLTAAHDLNSTLQRVFHFAQLNSSTLPLDRERIPLSNVVDEAVHALRARAAEVRISVAKDVSECVVVDGDVRQLSIAVREVLLNALVHAPADGAVCISILPVRDGLSGIEIRDQGPGMSAAALARCAEPFVQAADPLVRSVAGLGLGLPMARRIMEMHGGRLRIRSVPGEGVTVQLLIPCSSD